MSKKNNLATRRRLHEFELQREKQAKEKKTMKLQAKKNSMKLDGVNKKKNKRNFVVGKKKLKTKLSATAKAKAAQAMELDN
ncbi:hypothetical protein RND81_03G208300 [Saponaria officinalis]|uniref:Uncharacterized protein n=1 Tax=Saponaria officinalis TaxID=3572 RepID=A0AAW1M1W4_SAPOF